MKVTDLATHLEGIKEQCDKQQYRNAILEAAGYSLTLKDAEAAQDTAINFMPGAEEQR